MNPENKKIAGLNALSKMIDDIIQIDDVSHVKFNNGVVMRLDSECEPPPQYDEWVKNVNDLPMISQSLFTNGELMAIGALKRLMMQPCVNGDWIPDWNDTSEKKWCIIYYKEISINSYERIPHFLAFRNSETAEKFMDFYIDYIETAAPILFGITL